MDRERRFIRRSGTVCDRAYPVFGRAGQVPLRKETHYGAEEYYQDAGDKVRDDQRPEFAFDKLFDRCFLINEITGDHKEERDVKSINKAVDLSDLEMPQYNADDSDASGDIQIINSLTGNGRGRAGFCFHLIPHG